MGLALLQCLIQGSGSGVGPNLGLVIDLGPGLSLGLGFAPALTSISRLTLGENHDKIYSSNLSSHLCPTTAEGV